MTAGTAGRVQVGREIRHEFGWLWARTKRLANLLLHPHILHAATDLVQGLERWSEINDVPDGSVTIGDAIFVKGLDYVEYPLMRE